MSYIWFNLVLEALGKRLNYESVSNLYGNSFAKDSAKLIQAANPLIKAGATQSNGISAIASQIKIIDTRKNKKGSTGIKAAEKQLGDLSWVGDFMGGGAGATPFSPGPAQT